MAPVFLGIQSIRLWRFEERTRGIRLSTLLLVVAFVAATVAGIGRIHRQRLIERPIVSEIESQIDGEFKTDFDGLATELILWEFGEGSLGEILELLGQLAYVERLQLNRGRISPKEAVQVGHLANLQELSLSMTDMDDHKIQQLVRLRKLRDLNLIQTEVTGEGLKHLAGARRLRRLWLSNDKISPEDVERLRTACPRLDVSYRAPSAQ